MNETLKMELEEFIEMLRSDHEMAMDSAHPATKVIGNYLSDIEEIYKNAFGEN